MGDEGTIALLLQHIPGDGLPVLTRRAVWKYSLGDRGPTLPVGLSLVLGEVQQTYQQSRADSSIDGTNGTKTNIAGSIRLLLSPRTGAGQSEVTWEQAPASPTTLQAQGLLCST